MNERVPSAEALAPPGRRLGAVPLIGLAASGSLLMALGTPPGGLPWLIWLGFVPLVMVARLARPARWPRLFGLGVAGGVCTGMVGFPWIADTLVRFGGFPAWAGWIGLLCFSLWTAIPFGLWMVVVARGPRRGIWAVVWPVVTWPALAAAWPAFFPYTVVIGWGQTPAWIQAAELGGVALCEMLAVVVGVMVADALCRTGPRRVARLFVAGSIPVLSWGIGSWRMSELDERAATSPKVRFGLIQPNSALFDHDLDGKMKRLRDMSRAAQNEGAQVIVWPEAGTYPFLAERPFVHDSVRLRERVLTHHRLPTIFGVATVDPGAPYEYNSVAAMNERGDVIAVFDKVNLVPFGEEIPLVDPAWARAYVPAMAHNFAGEGPVRFEVDPPVTDAGLADAPFGVGPLICYEDIFSEFARETAMVSGGIEVFVNVTIDTWFGDSAEPWEHLALAQFRSVEHRIPMVRAVATGATSYIDSSGRLAASLAVRDPVSEPHAPERLVVDVAMPRNTAAEPTVYSRFGWLVRWICTVIGLAGLLAHGVRRKYSRARRVDSRP